MISAFWILVLTRHFLRYRFILCRPAWYWCQCSLRISPLFRRNARRSGSSGPGLVLPRVICPSRDPLTPTALHSAGHWGSLFGVHWPPGLPLSYDVLRWNGYRRCGYGVWHSVTPPRFLEFIGAPESARLLSRSPANL